jgi:hypothetical protein
VALALDVDLPLAPTMLGRSAASIAVRATHTERYSSFRESAR